MIGVPGTAHRLFGALREEGISVILISQGSSEHSICCAIPQEQAERAAAVVRARVRARAEDGQIQSVDVDADLAILAVVGDGMAGTPGIAAKVFAALGIVGSQRARHRPGRLGAQHLRGGRGQAARPRALRAVHAGLYLSPHTLSIGVIGPGTVGRVLLDQLASQSERLRREFSLDLRVRGIIGSQRMLLADAGISARRLARAAPGEQRRPPIWRASSSTCAPTTCRTPSSSTARRARRSPPTTPTGWRAGIHVVTPNKKANSGDLAYYQRLQRGAPRRRRALSLRGDGRGGAAGDADAARPARDGR